MCIQGLEPPHQAITTASLKVPPRDGYKSGMFSKRLAVWIRVSLDYFIVWQKQNHHIKNKSVLSLVSHLKGPNVFIKPIWWFYKVFSLEKGEVTEQEREGGKAEIPPRWFSHKSSQALKPLSLRRSWAQCEETAIVQDTTCFPSCSLGISSSITIIVSTL